MSHLQLHEKHPTSAHSEITSLLHEKQQGKEWQSFFAVVMLEEVL